MSTELKGTFTGRQYVVASKQDLDFGVDFVAVGDVDVGTLPEGSVITSGWLQVLNAGAVGAVVVTLVDPSDGSTFATLATGAAATPAKTDITVDGVPTVKAYNIVVNSATAQTAGDGYLHLEYIVSGRQNFSEG